MKEKVAIVGAGVSGLTCGVLLAEAGWKVAVVAEATGARITSGAAAAIWFPYDAEPAESVTRWALETFTVLRQLSGRAETGVSMLELRQLSRRNKVELPQWASSLGAQLLNKAALPNGFVSGYRLKVPLTDTSRYLDYLQERLGNAGGEIRVSCHLDQLEEAPNDFSLVLNCTGIGARTLVPDPEVEPHRGQVVIVPKIDLPCALVCDDSPLMYAIPRTADCVFGGTNEVSASWIPERSQSRQIVAECVRTIGIEPPAILAERVGLRPFRRAGICLREERLRDGRRVIHNYGHGGAGFTLSWGCAKAAQMLAEVR